ncbi:hypothetical protein AO268_22395 [Pseudomonas sp. ICMP 8385]|jgi:hypothetical protein|uniref:hypothetical protein n=1 Tax=Pseudomonas sp. ICMP 8385 TaxID=1718920 RepID=UPI000C0832E4|nr:hypothetical protein [Pseudomonas sp. ICMP 8385]PHN66464.1 hypothetical protein AO268_22395 [Pseudomonas sp. ICMP 8385]
MRGLIIIALLLIVGQASAEQLTTEIRTFHDVKRGVTCWVFDGLRRGGISCLPDSSLLQAPASTATDESQADRASLATSMCQIEQLPATPLPQEQGFQL